MMEEVSRKITLSSILKILVIVLTFNFASNIYADSATYNCCCQYSYCRWYNQSTDEYMSASFEDTICFTFSRPLLDPTYPCTIEEFCEYMLPTGNWEVSYGCFGNCWEYEDSSCTSMYLLGEGDPRLDILRQLRDEVLSQTPEGQEIIRLYYELSPAIVKAMEEDEEFKGEVKEMIDGVLGLIE